MSRSGWEVMRNRWLDRGEAGEGLEAFGEVVGIEKGREVSLELPAGAGVIAPDGGFLVGAVHALDLAVIRYVICGATLAPGMEHAHPADLMGADPFRCARRAFRPEISGVRECAGKHSSDVLRYVARSHMGELVGKARPLMHLSEKIRHLDERVYVVQLKIQFLGRGGNSLANGVTGRVPASRRTPSSLPFRARCARRFRLKSSNCCILREPLRAVELDAEAELVHRPKCRSGANPRLLGFLQRPRRPRAARALCTLAIGALSAGSLSRRARPSSSSSRVAGPNEGALP